jgi:hypothetical protein
VIGGRTIPMDDLEKLRINETAESSEDLLPIIRAERRASGVATTIPDDWYIADHGREVTDQLITAPRSFPATSLREPVLDLSDDACAVHVDITSS